MKEIKLPKGRVALVDDEDYERVNQFRWRATKEFNTLYAVRVIKVNGRRTTLRMHRFILCLTDRKMQIDHRNGDGLNNQRSNLRSATNQENGRNRVGVNKTSQFKGVCFDKERNKFLATIKVNYKSIHIGRFPSEIDAARAYDIRAKELFGEFARPNF